MPLPHFLMLVVAVIVAAGVTLIVAVSLGVPLPVLALGTVVAAAIAHLSARIGSGPRHTPDA